MPKHEAFRAIMLGTRPVYSEDYSSIGNPFDSRLSISRAQLLRLYILSALVNYASDAAFRHLDGSFIGEQLRKIGFGDSLVNQVLRDLCRHRFLFTASHGDASLSASFMPSRLGGLVVRDLLSNFTFLENVMYDTYIADSKAWETLRSLSQQIDSVGKIGVRMRLRAERVQVFFQYLSALYSPLVEESQKRGLSFQWCDNPFNNHAVSLRREIARVLLSARRSEQNRRREKERISIPLAEED